MISLLLMSPWSAGAGQRRFGDHVRTSVTCSGGLSPVRGREAPCTPGLKLPPSGDPHKSSFRNISDFIRSGTRNAKSAISIRLGSKNSSQPKSKFRPLASHGTPERHSKTRHRCDTRRHGRSGDHKRGRRRVFEYQKVFLSSSMFSYRSLQVSATLDIVLPSEV